MEMNKAMELLRGLVSEIERQTCEHAETHRGGAIWEICDSCGAKWADDEGGKPEFEWPESVEKAREFLAAHPTVEQAGGDEREAAIAKFAETCPMTAESAAGGNSYDIKLRRYYLLGWDDRTALAQPSPAIAAAPTYQFQSREIGESDWAPCDFRWYLYCSKSPEMDTRVVEVAAQPSPAQAEQAEAERPEVVARVVHSNPFVLDHCGPLNANDELMTVAQHAASVARWAEMFNRVEQERDAALARVEQQERTIAGMNEAHAKLAGLYEAAQAQHSVPEGWMLVPVEPLLNMMSDKDHDTRITAERQLLSILAAAPGKEVGHE
ncbi:hypothetical protein AB3W22_15815 [Pseudomonas aeruginosa]|uniref:hypothetical protein n=1 Tax=Pseudomonas aeruginosa TaxID=287 RepID=UPI0034A141C1